MNAGLIFTRFTDSARKAIKIASQNAKAWHHNQIMPQHIVEACFSLSYGTVAQNVFKELEVGEDKFRQMVNQMDYSTDKVHPSFSMNAENLLDQAIHYIDTYGPKFPNNKGFVGTEHLAFAALTFGDVCDALGTTQQAFHKTLCRLLGVVEKDEKVEYVVIVKYANGVMLWEKFTNEVAARQFLASRNAEPSVFICELFKGTLVVEKLDPIPF